jgi:hypothetical protein
MHLLILFESETEMSKLMILLKREVKNDMIITLHTI